MIATATTYKPQQFYGNVQPLQKAASGIVSPITVPNPVLKNILSQANTAAQASIAPALAQVQAALPLIKQPLQTWNKQQPQILRNMLNNYQPMLQQGATAGLPAMASHGLGNSGLAIQNSQAATGQVLQNEGQTAAQTAQQGSKTVSDYATNMISNYYQPYQQVMQSKGNEAAKQYLTLIGQAQDSILQGRVFEAQNLLQKAQATYSANSQAIQSQLSKFEAQNQQKVNQSTYQVAKKAASIQELEQKAQRGVIASQLPKNPRPGNAGTSDFVKTMLPYAQTASAELGIPAEVILGQWALESDWGRSNFARNRNNLGGIGAFDSDPNHAYSYSSLADYTQAYINLLKNPRYAPVLQAARNGASPYEIGQALAKTGYVGPDGAPTYPGKIASMTDSVRRRM